MPPPPPTPGPPDLPPRVRLVVLFGGQSAEHEVSCTSATHVLRAVDQDRYDVEAVGITREGTWVHADDAAALLAGGIEALPTGSLRATGTEVEPLPTVLPEQAGTGEDAPVVVLPLLHGTRGEDGTVQGLLELAGVPFVGSGVLGSALCMDKLKAKDVLAAHGLPQVGWVGCRDVDLDGLVERVADAGLPYPVFVKPANLGSSVGVSKVDTPDGLADAAALAAQYDEWIIVEEGVVRAREVEVGVLGDLEPRASVPGEVIPGHDFYDYEDKYVDDAVELVVPAELDEATTAEVQRLAVTAFTALRCEGMARVDLFLDPADGRLLVNEVNTIPGFTPVSQFPRMWEASGLAYPDLVDELVRLALARHARRSRLSTKR
jgi:D-alanine-D-alanine ligase